MKLKLSFITILLSFCVFNLSAQLDQAYFQRLKTERVASEDDIQWKQFGPGNAGFSNLVRYHPTKPDVLIMVPDLWVVWQSEDNGKSWYNVKDKDGNGQFERLRDIYYSPNDENLALAIEGAQLWESNTMGRSWSIVKNCPWYTPNADGSDNFSWQSKISALGIDNTDDKTWYVGAGNHIRGQQFLGLQQVSASNPRGNASLLSGKIWKTSDSGATWKEQTTGIDPMAQFVRIITNPTNNQQVFAASNYGLYRSNDGGATWVNIGETRLPNNTILDMDFYFDQTSNSFVLYVVDQVRYAANGTSTSNNGGIFKSTDGGENFTDITGDLYLDINQLTGGVPFNYYAYVAKWLGITTAQAQTLYPVKPTNALQYFNSINVDPSRPDALYVGFADAQIQRSIIPGRLWGTSNGGQHWENVSRDFQPAWENDKAYWESRNNPFNDNMEMGHEPFFQQWSQNYPLRSLRGCTVNSRGDVMIIAAHNTLLSTDKGVSFKQVDEEETAAGNLMGNGNSNLPGESMFQDKRTGPDRPFLGSGEHRLWIPTDDGTNDRQAAKQLKNSTETISAICTHPLNEKIIFTTSFRQHQKEKIMRSTDGGITFEEWADATPAEWEMRTNALTIDPKNPDIMFFGITDKYGADTNKEGGFYFSEDGGKTFIPRNNGLPANVRIRDITIDPRDETNASYFAAAQFLGFGIDPDVQGGLYFTADRGLNWSKIEIDPKVIGVNSIAFDTTNRLYITSGHRDNQADNGGIWYSDDFGQSWVRIFDNARTEIFDVSPFDNNLLITTVGFLQKNCGIYLSEDRGLTWKKNNIDGLNTQIKDVQFDLHDAKKMWSVSMGNGFNIGAYPNGENASVVKVTPYKAAILLKETVELTGAIVKGNYAASDIVWSSSNPSIATVDTNGKVTAVAQGQAIITALINNRYSDKAVVTVNSTLSVNDVDSQNIEVSLFPNPAKDFLSVTKYHLVKNIAIYSLNGVEVIKIDNVQSKINISNLSTGIYFVKIQTTDNNTGTIKIVKQ